MMENVSSLLKTDPLPGVSKPAEGDKGERTGMMKESGDGWVLCRN